MNLEDVLLEFFMSLSPVVLLQASVTIFGNAWPTSDAPREIGVPPRPECSKGRVMFITAGILTKQIIF